MLPADIVADGETSASGREMARVHTTVLYAEYHQYMLLRGQRLESLPGPQERHFPYRFHRIDFRSEGGQLTPSVSHSHIRYMNYS